jgi:hypothetical protein
MDKSVAAGLAAIVAITIVTSYTTLAELALFVGWSEGMAWLFPAALDALALVACRIWLSHDYPAASRSYAKWVTLIASALSIAGNGVGHLASTGHLQPDLWLVVAVGSVAPASLAVVVHLASLVTSPVPGRKARHKVAEPAPAAKQQPAEDRIVPGPAKPRAKPKPKDKAPADFETLLAKAKEINVAHRAEHGTGISRNKLRIALTVGQDKATELIEQIKSEEVA